MTASFRPGENPYVFGTALHGKYTFTALRFVPMQMDGQRVDNDATACHLIDGETFPLELQLFAENAENGLIQISFLFTRQMHKNFCLEPLLGHLESVKSLKSFSETSVTFELQQILPKIESDFYVYDKYETVAGKRTMIQCIVVANALIPIGNTQLERIQAIQQNVMFRRDNGHPDEMNRIYLRQYLRQRRSSRLAMKMIKLTNGASTGTE